jgi:hypothetical protein
MPDTGRICDQSGVYRASCCAQEIRLPKGERCPPCDKHGATTWRLIRKLTTGFKGIRLKPDPTM